MFILSGLDVAKSDMTPSEFTDMSFLPHGTVSPCVSGIPLTGGALDKCSIRHQHALILLEGLLSAGVVTGLFEHFGFVETEASVDQCELPFR